MKRYKYFLTLSNHTSFNHTFINTLLSKTFFFFQIFNVINVDTDKSGDIDAVEFVSKIDYCPVAEAEEIVR